MIQDFIVATKDNGKKVLIQQHSIFYMTEDEDGKGTIIQSIGAGENHLKVKESLSLLIEKIDRKK